MESGDFSANPLVPERQEAALPPDQWKSGFGKPGWSVGNGFAAPGRIRWKSDEFRAETAEVLATEAEEAREAAEKKRRPALIHIFAVVDLRPIAAK